MKRPWLAGSFLNCVFCLSAITSTTKPKTHNPIPKYPDTPISTVVLDVSAASPAAIVTNTHSPPIVQVIKNHVNLVFITTNRESWPSFLILQNKKLPNLPAHMTIMAQIIRSLISREGFRTTATITVVM